MSIGVAASLLGWVACNPQTSSFCQTSYARGAGELLQSFFCRRARPRLAQDCEREGEEEKRS
jgi:hypothetical protein